MNSKTALITNCIFEEPWWLDAVCRGLWDRVEVTEGTDIVGHLSFRIRSLAGFHSISPPPLTPVLGPWIADLPGKESTRLRRRKAILTQLIDKLPKADGYIIKCHKSINDMLPFYWNGFEATVHYTYILPNLSDLARIWEQMQPHVRQQIRKAEKYLVAHKDGTIEDLKSVIISTYARQKLKIPFDLRILENIFHAVSERNQGRILVAVDGSNKVQGAILLVWDKDSAYYLIGGSLTEGKQMGVSSFLLWKSIEYASGVTREFDFEGSSIPSIESFFSCFGGNLTPYYWAIKRNLPFRTAQMFRRLLLI